MWQVNEQRAQGVDSLRCLHLHRDIDLLGNSAWLELLIHDQSIYSAQEFGELLLIKWHENTAGHSHAQRWRLREILEEIHDEKHSSWLPRKDLEGPKYWESLSGLVSYKETWMNVTKASEDGCTGTKWTVVVRVDAEKLANSRGKGMLRNLAETEDVS